MLNLHKNVQQLEVLCSSGSFEEQIIYLIYDIFKTTGSQNITTLQQQQYAIIYRQLQSGCHFKKSGGYRTKTTDTCFSAVKILTSFFDQVQISFVFTFMCCMLKICLFLQLILVQSLIHIQGLIKQCQFCACS